MKSNKNTEKVSGEKVKRFPKFHILDIVIIILIVAMLVGIYFRYNVFEIFGNFQNQSEAQLTFSVTNIKDSTQYYINIDDAVYLQSDGKSLGTIMRYEPNADYALKVYPSTEDFVKEDGTIISAAYPEDTRSDIEGKIKCVGTFSDDGTFLLDGSTYISPGKTLIVCTEKVTLQILITDISKIEE